MIWYPRISWQYDDLILKHNIILKSAKKKIVGGKEIRSNKNVLNIMHWTVYTPLYYFVSIPDNHRAHFSWINGFVLRSRLLGVKLFALNWLGQRNIWLQLARLEEEINLFAGAKGSLQVTVRSDMKGIFNIAGLRRFLQIVKGISEMSNKYFDSCSLLTKTITNTHNNFIKSLSFTSYHSSFVYIQDTPYLINIT